MTDWGWTAVLAVTATLATTSCECFRGMGPLRRELIEEFHASDVVLVRATDRSLTVTLQKPFPYDEEQQTCRRIAEFVRDHYEDYSDLSTVRVGFATRRSVAGVDVSRTKTLCSFTRGELGKPSATAH
jgi:hypothetical protein